MATNDPPKSPGRQLTPDDVISICIDQLMNMGEIGLSTEWQPEDVVAAITIDDAILSSASPGKAALLMGHQPTVLSVLREEVDAWKRERELTKCMLADMPLMQRTMEVVEQRLLAAGMSQSDLDKYEKIGLRVKVRWLYELQNLRLLAPEYVQLRLYKSSSEGREVSTIHLPVKGTLAEITAILNNLSLVVDDKGETVNLGSGPWVYQLLDKEGRPKPGRESLRTDADYYNLVKRVRMPGSATPSAAFYQRSTMIYHSRAKKEKEAEEAEYLDEDGNMCFEPINWDTLFRTTFGEVVNPVPEGGSPMMEMPIRASPYTKMPMQVSPMMEIQANKAEPREEPTRRKLINGEARSSECKDDTSRDDQTQPGKLQETIGTGRTIEEKR
ncbi:MAG: hypothetical protein Q9187_001319 [Circinaria calcarea]